MSTWLAASMFLLFLGGTAPSTKPVPIDHALPSVPAGYNLIACDDAGVPDRQPHLLSRPEQVHTYNTFEVQGDAKARSVAWDYAVLKARHDGLDPGVPYVLAITYANEPYNNRVQSLWAGGICIQAAHALPKGKSERLIFRVPAQSIRNGVLDLEFRLEAQVNVVVSFLELYAPLPAASALHIDNVSGLPLGVEGAVTNFTYDPAAGVEVQILSASGRRIASAHTAADGTFRFDRKLIEPLPHAEVVVFRTRQEGTTAELRARVDEILFEPVRYRPMPADSGPISLDGTWKIDPKPTGSWRDAPLSDVRWHDWRVPGQWVQQGFDVAKDQTVAVSREFSIPPQWAGQRIILRFDAIHAGTTYWLNGRRLGYSENLFTPVEWDITQAVKPGQMNRLDLGMKVDTVSEALSFSSDYAFHNLGGIDRSVRIFKAGRIRSLHVSTDLDQACTDARLDIDLAVDPIRIIAKDETDIGLRHVKELILNTKLCDPSGKTAGEWSDAISMAGSADPVLGHMSHTLKDPLKWTAETPRLYKLVLDLSCEGRRIERVERRIGFRKIEIRDRQMYINGRRVKLAGVCRHEIDALAGRADTARHAGEDVRLLKAANLNYIRTSHYPPTQEFLDAADELGMYVECEAPLCWVNDRGGMRQARQVLTPTSAMIDYCHTHPSIIVWSLANESQFCSFFEPANALIKQLDPTRPTTFNNPDPRRVCDIGNMHYPPMPYDAGVKNDPRPQFLGEYFFPVCHEQTDVSVNPGLRELYGQGHAEPESVYGKAAAAIYAKSPYLTPGALPGAWSYIVHNDQLIGGAIWAALDEPFYLPGGKKVGYNWVHGPWGLLDAWRRPKPEYYIARCVFSPVWFPSRHVAFAPGQASISLPVENRYSFTDLSQLNLTATHGQSTVPIQANMPPGKTGQIEVQVPASAKPGDVLTIAVRGREGEWINQVNVTLGESSRPPLPQPDAGAPSLQAQGDMVIVEGQKHALVFDRKTGDFVASDPRHRCAITRFPMPHLSRFDFGDLLPSAPKYAVLPEARTRVVESATIQAEGSAVRVQVRDRYDSFAGTTTLVIDRTGATRITIDYAYLGADTYARELGARLQVTGDCDTVEWDRWSEWGNVFPDDCISRTRGLACARRDANYGHQPENVKPTWPWSLDQTELGTAGFRSTKFNIYQAVLRGKSGRGVRVLARGEAHVRACLADNGVTLHLISQCWLAPVVLKKQDHLQAAFTVQLIAP